MRYSRSPSWPLRLKSREKKQIGPRLLALAFDTQAPVIRTEAGAGLSGRRAVCVGYLIRRPLERNAERAAADAILICDIWFDCLLEGTELIAVGIGNCENPRSLHTRVEIFKVKWIGLILSCRHGFPQDEVKKR